MSTVFLHYGGGGGANFYGQPLETDIQWDALEAEAGAALTASIEANLLEATVTAESLTTDVAETTTTPAVEGVETGVDI